MPFEDWKSDRETSEQQSGQNPLFSDAYSDLPTASDRKNGDGEKRQATPEELDQRREKVFASPEVKQFMGDYEAVLKTGKITDAFLKSAKEIGQKCLKDYDTFYFLWHKLNENGIHLSSDKNGVTFSRTEYLGGRDGIGHPAIPYGQNEYSLTVPFDGSAPKGNKQTWLRDSNPFERNKPESLDKDNAAKKVFMPDPEPDHRRRIDEWIGKVNK